MDKQKRPVLAGKRATEIISDQTQAQYSKEYREASRFLTLLDENAESFTFQTFDDNADRKDGNLSSVLNGSLEKHYGELVRLNVAGAGVFVTINETDLKGRKKNNIRHIRAVWQEADRGDTPMLPMEPHIEVASSPGKYHRYILTDTDSLNEFERVQARLVKDYGSDPNAADVSRVLRLPGFYHQKVSSKKGLTGIRHLVGITHKSGEQPLTWEQVKKLFPPVKDEIKTDRPKGTPKPLTSVDEVKSALEAISPDCYYTTWLNIGMALHSTGAGEQAFTLWDEWSAKGDSYRDGETAYKWNSFKPDGGITLKTLFKYAQDTGWRWVPPTYSRDDLAEMIDALDPEDIDTLEAINQKIADSELSKIAQDILHKKMKRKTGVNLTALRADIGDERTELDQQELVERTINRIGKDNLLYSLDYFWQWDACGIWKRSDDRALKRHVHRVYDDAGQGYYKGSVDSVLDLVKTETYRDGHQFDSYVDSINTLSGELHYEASTWTLKPHVRAHYRTTQLPVEFTQEAQAPRFQQFLEEIFAGDSDAAVKAQMVLELIGYTLLSTCRFEKFALLIGSGANGKSVLLAVIEALLGREYVVAVQPSQFDNRFQRAHLHGKLANIVTEIAEGAEIADAQLKAIVSGELTTAEHKHKPPFDFRPIVTCWFGTNHMPHTRDFSDALFRRAVVVTFPNKFEGERCDAHLKDKLLEELPGILNLALRAIAGVFDRGEFTTCRDNEEAKQRWRLEADQVAQYVDECCDLMPAAKVKSSDLYAHYQRWADGAGVRRKVNQNNFVARLRRLGVEPVRRSQARWLHGVRVSDVSDAGFGIGYKP